MKILLTGGGGGHFYPIIAVARELNKIIDQEKIIGAELIFMSDKPYDQKLLDAENIRFRKTPAGKIRKYFSLLNIIDIFKTFIGVIKTLWIIYIEFPDVVFSKGGYASFPSLFAARFFKIPVIIHESDSVPGKVSKWASSFAKRIALSYKQTAKYFPNMSDKIAVVGNPIRMNISNPSPHGAREFLKLEDNLPVILVLGGSQGAQKINDILIDILPELTKKYQIIHQCGEKNLKKVKERANIVLEKSDSAYRYHAFGFLNETSLKMSAGSADFVISRAGSTLFEIAAWGLPSILIPITNSAQNHQRENAYAYAESGATDVIEEKNFTPHILMSEIDRIFADKDKMESMKKAAKDFSKPQAAYTIAKEIINIALKHA